MDYELIFWIVSGIGALVGMGLLMTRANKELYVDWAADLGGGRHG